MTGALANLLEVLETADVTSLSTIAGNIIENAGGPHALKYGVTFNHTLSVDIVLADGRAG